MTAIEVSPEEMERLAAKKKEKKEKKEKSEKKEKKEKKKRKREVAGSDQDDENRQMEEKDGSSRSRIKKRDKRKELLNLVPERDEDGIVYTKLQRRRMMKRVKRGLPPVPTPEEEDERRKNEAQLKREEEEELSGMIYNRDSAEKDDESDAEENQEGDADEENEEANLNEREASTNDEPMESEPVDGDQASVAPAKKSKRSKPVPVDYVCQACKNQHTPIHWIYDCPDKVTVRGTNQVSKKVRGVHDPDAKKVFVSGLPFETKRKDIDQMFASCGKMVHCKLLTFEDTGRCKGQAYLTFDTESGAKKAIALSGTVIDHFQENPKKTTEVKRKELKLKVTKMLNRSATKQGSRA